MKILGIGMTERNVPKVMTGDKTQTRRIESALKDLVEFQDVDFIDRKDPDQPFFRFAFSDDAGGVRAEDVSPRHWIGDILYVKEALERWEQYGKDPLTRYKADFSETFDMTSGNGIPWKWKNKVLPARYMPKIAARTFIQITDVRCERVNKISWRDVKAEGVDLSDLDSRGRNRDIDAGARFANLWDETNGKGAWSRNDWVFAYSFKIVGKPENF